MSPCVQMFSFTSHCLVALILACSLLPSSFIECPKVYIEIAMPSAGCSYFATQSPLTHSLLLPPFYYIACPFVLFGLQSFWELNFNVLPSSQPTPFSVLVAFFNISLFFMYMVVTCLNMFNRSIHSNKTAHCNAR